MLYAQANENKFWQKAVLAAAFCYYMHQVVYGS